MFQPKSYINEILRIIFALVDTLIKSGYNNNMPGRLNVKYVVEKFIKIIL